MFGVLTMHLSRLVNSGHSFEGAEDLFNLLSAFPLRHSFFHLFQPQRHKLRIPEPSNQAKDITNFYLMEYDRDQGVCIGQFHSEVSVKMHFKIHNTEGLKKLSRRNQNREVEGE